MAITVINSRDLFQAFYEYLSVHTGKDLDHPWEICDTWEDVDDMSYICDTFVCEVMSQVMDSCSPRKRNNRTVTILKI